MKEETLTTLRARKRAGYPVVLATALPSGEQWLLPDPASPPTLNEAAETVAARDESATVAVAGQTWFLHVFNPPPRLVLIGAVHIAQALAPLAARVGFNVIIVDPRRAFASAERFPGVVLSDAWPDEALERLAPDQRTAVVTLTHDPKLDDPALDRALRSPAFYVGALGSRKTHAARLKRLSALGHDEAVLQRIYGPVGLPIEAVTTGEIAVSILAEIVAVRRGADTLWRRAA